MQKFPFMLENSRFIFASFMRQCNGESKIGDSEHRNNNLANCLEYVNFTITARTRELTLHTHAMQGACKGGGVSVGA